MTISHRYPYPPGGPTVIDRLLQGSFDLHHHGFPEISFDCKTRMEDVDEFSDIIREVSHPSPRHP